MKIDTTKLTKFVDNFKQLSTKVNKIEDALPLIKQELPKTIPNVNIETSNNVISSAGNVTTQSKQIKQLLETSSVIPVRLPRVTPQAKLTNGNTVALTSNNKKQPLTKIGYASANITTKWLLDNDVNS